MSTTSTDYSWFWYVRKKGARHYLGIVDENGDAPTSALTIEIWYDEFADELTSQDSILPNPPQFNFGILKGVAAELMAMSEKPNDRLIEKYEREYKNMIDDAIHHQVREAQQPMILKPLDLRDDG
jgi:hypothetical protein